jgi:hypothetical protein
MKVLETIGADRRLQAHHWAIHQDEKKELSTGNRGKSL